MSANLVETPTFILEGQLTSPDIYADGFTNLFFGFPNTRVIFHTVIEPPQEGAREQRRAVLTLTMPTLLAVQLARTILAGAKGNEPLLMQVIDQQVNSLKQAIAAPSDAALPEGMAEKKDYPVLSKPKPS